MTIYVKGDRVTRMPASLEDEMRLRGWEAADTQPKRATVTELKVVLDELGVTYKPRATKDELKTLVDNYHRLAGSPTGEVGDGPGPDDETPPRVEPLEPSHTPVEGE